MPLKQLKGYTVFAVQLDSCDGFAKPVHYMYIKKHVTKAQSETKTRSLFVVNVPVGADFGSVKKLMSDVALGAPIESFEQTEYYDVDGTMRCELNVNMSKLSNPDFGEEIEANRVPVGCGVVTFLDRDGMELALKSIGKLVMGEKKPPVWEVLPKGKTGQDRYVPLNNRLDAESLSEEVARAMREFQQREKEVEEELTSMRETVDADGFTVVVGPHRKTKSGIMGSLRTLKDLESDERTAKKMKKKEKKDFYRFQIRERKKQEVNDLLKKFKDDQERVKEMREKRKFKPY